ncbi:MAG: tRNA pseudouridine(55) synthase TruB [Thermoleophilia bacterium]|nr:tRNA pseudouridine(55) synthase TruB [Thermoleophilia bacterium]
MASPSCVVLVDKPVGPTSYDIVRVAKRGLSVKLGHAGTLDPFASGLLLLLVGSATRVSSLLMGLPKEYEFIVQFGAVSATGDPTGDINPTGKQTTARQVVEVLGQFLGRVRQRVPMTSAVKVNGKPLYQRAHRGESVETPEREVTIYDLSLIEFDEEKQQGSFVALVSSGTYIRVLAADLGAAVGTGGYALALRRTRVGGFCVCEALKPEDLSYQLYLQGGQGVLSVDEALRFLPAYYVADNLARMAENGNDLPAYRKGKFRVHGPRGLIAVYEGEQDIARPVVVMPRG